ncbi:MAG: inositol monophosphatase [Anaerolineae bacterium]|nr:inositol monophosphatase [Anaerolineae bacterium]
MTDPEFLEELVETASLAAYRAGELIREQYTQPRQVKQKNGPRDLVTQTDKAAQDVILDIIQEKYPDHFILAEENPDSHPDEDGNWTIPDGPVWMVDPIDGTTNYVFTLPMFCVSIGFALDGKPAAGVIYDPLRDELWAGAVGLGASFNGKELPPLEARPLENSILCVDWGHNPVLRQEMFDTVDSLIHHFQTFRSLGSAALGLAYVANQRVQFYGAYALAPYDLAAGAALIRAVGGNLMNPGGQPWQLGQSKILAGHPATLDAAMGLINGVS